MFTSFPHYKQLDLVDCGPSCLRIIAKYYGKTYSLGGLREKSYYTREGVTMLGISDAAESLGFRTLGVKATFDMLKKDAPVPFIAHWRQRHFLVVYGFKRGKVLISDPAHGLVTMSEEEFKEGWFSTKEDGKEMGLALMLEPKPEFYKGSDEEIKKSGFNYFLGYLWPHRKFISQLLIGLLVGSALQLSLPFLTQSVVDFGIQNQNIDFIVLILIAQLFIMVSIASVEFIRGWILLHLGARINIALLSDFLVKLMKLPHSFFETKTTGDLLKRIDDHHRIEEFLTSSSLSLVFSFVSVFVFGFVLFLYDLKIFFLFAGGSTLYIVWVLLFLKKRRSLDYRKFDAMAAHQNKLLQLLDGMSEIKLHNCEKQKRWGWEKIQVKLFKLNMKSLSLSQYQWAGSLVIKDSINIVISFIAAKSVVDGEITLGMMMSIQYIIGQLNVPIQQFVTFMHATQDAKISMERLGEIHNEENDEEEQDYISIDPKDHSINISKVSFQYGGPHSAYALKDIDMHIPQGKVTAIVGASGSGKTTLLKLLLRFYKPTSGRLDLGEIPLENFDKRSWREKCGAVMQDGFIFSDTIAGNIAIKDEYPDRNLLYYAVQVANIQEFIESLPLAYNTKIGSEGVGISQGQRQRMLIARAVYKNPEYLFFDEATNALDASNEKVIMNNLNEFYKGKTVVVVAHRLSTVKNADQIIVLQKGSIVETGTHEELVQKKGYYYELVKNQLELGN